ncbi:MAG: 30S ribosomal protein S7 [Candidatus Omnitrophica bacterium]|nr:30S ribosomal protein S7 [Candidatus Omnitrophota bacterium]
MRKKQSGKRQSLPDAKYNSRAVQKFINMTMMRGKKSIAERIVYDALDMAAEKLKVENRLEVFQKALENARPHVEVKARRVGGATYQVPVEVRQDRGTFLAMRWLRDFARSRTGKPMKDRLAEEFMAAYQGQGSAVKKKDDMHRSAEANKAFSHYRW